MRILFSLTYYYPHISGLTIYAQRLAEALVSRGHDVTILTSQHDSVLPREDTHEGVRIIRIPVSFRIGKGPVMASYLTAAPALLRQHDLVFLNLPATPVESLTLAILGRFFIRRPVVAVYQCDLQLPPGLTNLFIEKTLFLLNVVAGLCLTRITVMTEDYANHSKLLGMFRRKREIMPPGVVMPTISKDEVSLFRRRVAPGAEHVIGFAGRLATEKGIEYLLAALELIHEEFPRTTLLFTVYPEAVVGEREYWQRIEPLLARVRDHCEFLGTLPPDQLALFYGACDVTVLPSVNSTEAFGLVQLESMLCGTPVVASDLPGVREAISTTGMGRLVSPRDARALADALVEVITNRHNYLKSRAEIENLFSFESMVDRYEKLFRGLKHSGNVDD